LAPPSANPVVVTVQVPAFTLVKVPLPAMTVTVSPLTTPDTVPPDRTAAEVPSYTLLLAVTPVMVTGFWFTV